jgi:hypothetical protein
VITGLTKDNKCDRTVGARNITFDNALN